MLAPPPLAAPLDDEELLEFSVCNFSFCNADSWAFKLESSTLMLFTSSCLESSFEACCWACCNLLCCFWMSCFILSISF